MPRKIHKPGDPVPEHQPSRLAQELANELRSSRDFGQPWVDERRLDNGLTRVSVLWDYWDAISFEERTRVILDAYRLVEGGDFVKTIVLASGLTFPEAFASGMLPYQIISARRRNDPVTVNELREAMVAQGASTLMNRDFPQLRFSSLADAEACLQRMIQHLPTSEQVWQITQDVGQVVEVS